MAGEDDASESDSVKNYREIEYKCIQCRKKVVEPIKCYKCNEIFHPKCMEQAANQKSSNCRHEEANVNKMAKEINELQTENKIMNIEITYLKQLLKETQEKNKILMENNSLLINKIKSQDEEIENPSQCRNVNKEEKNKGREQRVDNKQSKQGQNAETELRADNKLTYAKVTDCRTLELPTIKGNVTNHPNSQIGYANAVRQNREQIQTQPDKEWTTIQYKKRNRTKSSVICTGTNRTNNTIIRGAAKRRWIYVGRIQGKDITEQQIEEYLGEINKNEKAEVKKLDTLGNNSAFSVGVYTDESYDSICKPEIWPEGVVVREFSFRNLFRKNRSTT